ncbi:MAG TPA: MerR family transcriptional regulator, partial [Flavobacterium sp.]
QTDTITPAHEHFISFLIKQKLLINTEALQTKPPSNHDKIFVLFLPMNEIHELGLMYLNYEILYNGYKSIYLGESVPLDNLKDIKRYFDNIIFVSYLTVQPDKNEINNYIERMNKEVINNNNCELWLIGRMLEHVNEDILNPRTSLFYSISDLVNKL